MYENGYYSYSGDDQFVVMYGNVKCLLFTMSIEDDHYKFN